MQRNFPELKDLPHLWFTAVPPRLRLPNGKLVPVEVKTLHPHGGLFFVNRSELQGVVDLEAPLSNHLGRIVTVEFKKPDSPTEFAVTAVVTHLERLSPERGEVGVVFLQVAHHTADVSEISATPELIPCPSGFLPIAWGNHSWFFNYRLQFHILGFVRGGMRLRFQRGIRGVLQSLAFDLDMVLPGVASFPTRVVVRDVNIEDSRELNECTVDFVEPSEALLDGISRYLFTVVPNLTPEWLDRAGYPFPELEFASVFHYAHTPEEISEMLALRLEAYKNREGSQLTAVNDPEVMRDRFDAHSLILSMRVAGIPVGTARLVFNDGDRSKSEIAEQVTLPEWLWSEGFVELSRSATSHYIRGRDVFANLRRHAIRVAFQCGFRYLLADCEAHLLEPYKRRGAQELGVQFTHPLEGKRLHVLYYDIPAILRGEVGDPEVWERFWKPMAKFLEERHQSQ